MKKIITLFIVSISCFASTKCFFKEGFVLSFEKQECKEIINQSSQLQGCYGFDLYLDKELIFTDEAARVLSDSEEISGGESLYISFISSSSPDIKRAFSINLKNNIISLIDPSLFEDEIVGNCQ